MKNQEKRLFIVYSLNLIANEHSAIKTGKQLYFSNLEKAEDCVQKYNEVYPFLYESTIHSESVYCIVIEEYGLDSHYRCQLSTRVYSPSGLLLSDSLIPDDGPFMGRQPDAIHHDIGEIVEIPYGSELVFGIVLEQPMTFSESAAKYGYTASDDCYTVIHHNKNDVSYAYAPLVFKPTVNLSQKVKEDLISAYKQFSGNQTRC